MVLVYTVYIVYIYTMKETVKQQVQECISEISRYSTVWNEKRVIIFPIHYRGIISITVEGKTKEFDYNEIEKATNYILERI